LSHFIVRYFLREEGRRLDPSLESARQKYIDDLDSSKRLVVSGSTSDLENDLLVIKANDKAETLLMAKSDPAVPGGQLSFEINQYLIEVNRLSDS